MWNFKKVKSLLVDTTGQHLKQWIRLAEDLAAANGGRLPKLKLLHANGYGLLCRKIRNHPKAFAHVRRKPREPKPETWVKWREKALALAAQHGGELPEATWMNQNGYRVLYLAMLKYPQVTEGLTRRKIRRKPSETLERWVEIKDRLLEEYGGELPNVTTLRELGHHGLARAINKNPEAFGGVKPRKHIQKKQETLKAHVEAAEKLALENGGALPTRTWLMEMGYSKVYNALMKQPDAFAHIPRQARKPRKKNGDPE